MARVRYIVLILGYHGRFPENRQNHGYFQSYSRLRNKLLSKSAELREFCHFWIKFAIFFCKNLQTISYITHSEDLRQQKWSEYCHKLTLCLGILDLSVMKNHKVFSFRFYSLWSDWASYIATQQCHLLVFNCAGITYNDESFVPKLFLMPILRFKSWASSFYALFTQKATLRISLNAEVSSVPLRVGFYQPVLF